MSAFGGPVPTVKRFTSPEQAVSAVVDALMRIDGLTSVALTGGRAGSQITSQLISRWHAQQPLRLWFSDERFLPLGDDGRNDSVALAAVQSQAHSLIEVESALGPQAGATVRESAEDYAARLVGHGLPQAAVVSIGPDGHVASLFPGRAALLDTRTTVVAVTDSPKPPPARITWTMPLLQSCPRILLVAVGADKTDVVSRVLDGDASLPATALVTAEAELYVSV